MKFQRSLILALLLAVLPATLTRASDAPPTTRPTYQNPLDIEIADPFIFREGGTYYLYGTAAGDGLFVWTSADLVNWTNRGHAFKRTPDTWSRRDFWAPELFKHDGKYYLHFTALGGREKDRRQRRVVLAEGESPLGPFKEIKAPWFDGVDRPVIDGHVFRDLEGQLYLYSVHLDSPPKQKCFEIHVRKLDEKLQPALETTMCISPSQEWEGELVNEGPFVLRHGDTYLLTWSANPYWDRNYSVGIATATSPLGPWTKSTSGPILKPSDHVSGPGHHSFIESPDGKELFIAYHVHRDAKNGRGGRLMAIDRARIISIEAGPTIQVNGPTHTAQPMPSGAPTR
ncbi:MAG: glycoside hydrolase family 43 protein [Tepidisphaeraceae bacterium]